MGASQLELSTSMKVVLLRMLAAGQGGLAPSRLISDLAALLRGIGHSEPAAVTSDAITGVVRAGLVASASRRLSLTQAGIEACLRILGERLGAARSWPRLRDTRLMAMALSMERASRPDVERLRTARGLRLAAVAAFFGLPRKALTSEAAMRETLASAAEGAGRSRKARPEARSAAGQRRIAARLLDPPREVGSDLELITLLAMQKSAARDRTIAGLRRALIARLLPRHAETSPDSTAVIEAARQVAAHHARGIPGSRRILIVDTIRHMRELRPSWRIEDERLKAMLLEAHRQGRIELATADLRSAADLAAIRASEVRHLSSAWHYIRVEDA